MKSGVPDAKLGYRGGYKFQGNSFEIFEKFFGTSNPFTVSLDEYGKQVSSMQLKQGNTLMDAFYKRFTDLTINVKCTLEELYYGCYKTVHYERLRLQGDSERQVMEVS